MKHLSKFAAILVTAAFVCLAFTGCSEPTVDTPETPTSGGNGGTPTYTVTISSTIEKGTVTASKTSGITAGETITLTVTPEDGYTLTILTVKNGEENVTITNNAFTMPNANVSVNATFSRILAQGKMGIYAVPKEIGDIVFTDGSATPYTEFTEENSMTNEQKAAAVAVIFDTENKLGVGLNTASKKWCVMEASAWESAQYATSMDNGKVNTDEIAGLSDYGEDKYPGVYFCTSYSAGNLTGGWYLPAKSELQKLYDNREAVGNAFTALGKTNPFESDMYYSSSQFDSWIYGVHTLNFADGTWGSYNKAAGYDYFKVCAVRAF